MSSDPLRIPRGSNSALVRQWAPWIAWTSAVAVAVGLNFLGADLGTAPAVAEVRSVALTSLVPWKLASVDVATGDAVTKGQVVARLDPAQLDARLAVARALLAVAEAKVTAKEAELFVSTVRLADQESTQAERAAVALSALEADEQRDLAKLAALDEQIDRETRLVAGQLSSVQALNELKLARAELVSTAQLYAGTVKRAREYQAGAARRSEGWRGKGAAAGEASGRLQAQLGPVKAEVVRAREEVAVLERQRETLDLKAPFAGRVGTVLLRAGDTVRADVPVLSIVDEHPTMVVAYVDQAWASAVQVGDQVDLVAIDRAGHGYTGRVTALGPNLLPLPLRFRAIPDKLTFSREAYVLLDPDPRQPVLPGQAFKADFRRGSGVGAAVKSAVGLR